jgi:FtsH-binding integral membrane protein
MSYVAYQDRVAANASVQERVDFIRLTYVHLGGAILAFTALCAALVNSSFAPKMLAWLGTGSWNWLLVLGLFMVAGYVAEKWAMSGGSVGKQYLGLALYIVAQAIIFVPILFIAMFYSDPSVIPTAGILTAITFGGLTGVVFLTKKDFSFLHRALQLSGFAAMGFIVVGIMFGFTLGSFFSAAMVLLAGGFVLYSTSNVLHRYPIGSHVAASLALFAAIATMFFYILRLVMAFSSSD